MTATCICVERSQVHRRPRAERSSAEADCRWEMPRYFFHVHYGDESYVDEVGEDLADDHAAWLEATSSTGESIRDLDGRLKPGTDWRMDVTAGDRLLYVIEVKARASASEGALKSSDTRRTTQRSPK